MKKILVAIMALLALGVGFVYLFPEQALKAEFARQRIMAGAEVRYKEVDGERWSYLEAGKGDLIVLVHGYTGAKENWLPIIGKLAKNNRVIAVDLPGWGENTPKADQDYGPVAQSMRLSAFLQSENPPVALLVGHSMGGMISGLLSAEHPELVQRLVLMSSAGVLFDENEFARQVQAGNNPFATYSAEAYLKFFDDYLFVNAPFIPKPLIQVLVNQRAARRAFEEKVFSQIRLGPEAFLLQERLPIITQPVGLLWCDQDKIIDPSAAIVFAKGLKKSETEILTDCGHMPMMEKPNAVAAFILKQL